MNTLLMLMAKHNGAAMISVDECRKEYFAPLTLDTFLRKIASGDIDLTVVRMESSQKGAKMVHLKDLADYIDRRRDEAAKEQRQMRA